MSQTGGSGLYQGPPPHVTFTQNDAHDDNTKVGLLTEFLDDASHLNNAVDFGRVI
jgi:hypothetical protein